MRELILPKAMMSILSLSEDYADRRAARNAELSALYNDRFALTDSVQREQAEALLGRIGTVDWKGEGYTDPTVQRDLSIKFHWGHDHRFADDLIVTGRMANRHIDLVAQFIEGFDLAVDHFQGRSVLDVGCWTGGTTLLLKALGAGRVTALEEVRKYAEATRILCNEIYRFSDVTAEPVSLYDFDRGRFDSVYVPGVIYHLSDPVLGLRRLYNRLSEDGDIFVETAGIVHDQSMCAFHGNRRFHDAAAEKFGRGGWNWFLPSPTCTKLWMEEAGFEDVRVFQSQGNRIFGYGRRVGTRDITRAGLSVPIVD